MKIILSRKGFDSSVGGSPSPIFEDGTLLSLPIPDNGSSNTFSDLHPRGINVGTLVQDLTKGRVRGSAGTHLDPDLDRSTAKRSPGWLPAFGQASAALRHLVNQGVGIGDLFLFFGWFRRVERVDGHYRYLKGAPDIHVIYGWLRIGQMLDVDRNRIPSWLREHPHVERRSGDRNMNYVKGGARGRRVLDEESLDVIYVARGARGGGIFKEYNPALQLTAKGATRSRWQLPAWFCPHKGRALSYHGNPDRWQRRGDCALLTTVGRGQEFVLDCDHFPKAQEWVRNTIGCKI